jgi:hypothetical protein
MSEIEGVVELGDRKRGKRTIIVRALGESGEVIEEAEHAVPQGKHLRVHKGDEVEAGEALVDGPLYPDDILRIRGEEAAQEYLLGEIQNVYRSQSVVIDDKHIEIILSQMMRKVQVTDPGDATFLPGAIVDRHAFRIANESMRRDRRKPATGITLLLGVTKASLSSDSFISAASFQETTKVLTEAAIAGKRDFLVGLKENVILGHLVPTGTGFRDHSRTRVKKNIDFGEIGGFGSIEPTDDDMAALLAGTLDPMAPASPAAALGMDGGDPGAPAFGGGDPFAGLEPLPGLDVLMGTLGGSTGSEPAPAADSTATEVELDSSPAAVDAPAAVDTPAVDAPAIDDAIEPMDTPSEGEAGISDTPSHDSTTPGGIETGS